MWEGSCHVIVVLSGPYDATLEVIFEEDKVDLEKRYATTEEFQKEAGFRAAVLRAIQDVILRTTAGGPLGKLTAPAAVRHL